MLGSFRPGRWSSASGRNLGRLVPAQVRREDGGGGTGGFPRRDRSRAVLRAFALVAVDVVTDLLWQGLAGDLPPGLR